MNETEEQVWPATWPSWVIQSLDELQVAESAMKDELLPHHAPEWAWRVLGELVKIANPTIRVANIGESGPRFLGRVVGHLEWLLKSDNGIQKAYESVDEAFERFDTELRKKLSKKAYARFLAEGEKYQPDVDRFLTAAGKVLETKSVLIGSVKLLADQQPFQENQDFYDGYGHALNVEVIEDDGHFRNEKLTSTTNIYCLLLMFWRYVINRIPSIFLLHVWLCRVLGSKQVGEIGRVKMICHRLRITLGPRGRPRKRK